MHHFEPSDGDRFVDDVPVSPDGSTHHVSRSNLGDVAAFDLTTPGRPQASTSTTAASGTSPTTRSATRNETLQELDGWVFEWGIRPNVECPHDSAHHGLAFSADGSKLCDCGTIDNTVSIVSTHHMQVIRTIDVGMVPYWATNSLDGRACFVSLSGGDAMSVIDYDTAQELTTVPVGHFPQRSRLGRVPEAVVELLLPAPG